MSILQQSLRSLQSAPQTEEETGTGTASESDVMTFTKAVLCKEDQER